jgi:cellulose synthase/poly-beta-1,6-N-acetylglucosamine synthase-like glycosyltransferase
MKTIEILLWSSVFIVFYTYIGYGLLLLLLVKIKESVCKPKDKIIPSDGELPEVTLFIAAYNEKSVIREKIENCRSLDYPMEKLKILFVTDGTNDGSVEILRKVESDGKLPAIIVEHSADRMGKAAAFNRGISFVKSPLVVFTDANTMLNAESIRNIVLEFTDSSVGCVAGEKRVQKGEAGKGAVATEGIYWKYESFLKAMDYRLCTAVGAAGELFAVRTALFEKLSKDTLLDDFMLSMNIASKGYKIAYCSDAYAVEGTSADMYEEAKRKVRISAGGLQSVWRLRRLLNLFRYGTLSFQYISHRVLRWTLAPLMLPFMLLFNLLLVFGSAGMIYNIMILLQLLFYVTGVAGWCFSKFGIKKKLPYVVYYFIFMNINVYAGAIYLTKRKGSGVWEKAKRA